MKNTFTFSPDTFGFYFNCKKKKKKVKADFYNINVFHIRNSTIILTWHHSWISIQTHFKVNTHQPKHSDKLL